MPSPALPHLTIADLPAAPPPPFLIEGVIQAGTVVGLHGATGKSLTLLDMLLHIASGTDWHGRAVLKRPCILVTDTDQHALGRRVRAWLTLHPDVDPDDIALTFVTDRGNGGNLYDEGTVLGIDDAFTGSFDGHAFQPPFPHDVTVITVIPEGNYGGRRPLMDPAQRDVDIAINQGVPVRSVLEPTRLRFFVTQARDQAPGPVQNVAVEIVAMYDGPVLKDVASPSPQTHWAPEELDEPTKADETE